MSRINIIKGNIRNVVDEAMFEKLYKPNGWRIDDSIEEHTNEDIAIAKTKTQLDNIVRMRDKKPKHFDDGLFYSDVKEGE